MNFSNTFLRACEELMRAGYALKLEEGACIGRGFADIGYEAFIVLPGPKLLSLFTGQQIPFQERERHFFFCIPSEEELLGFLSSQAWGATMELDEESGKIKLRVQQGEAQQAYAGRKLHVLLVEACTAILLTEKQKVTQSMKEQIGERKILLASASPRRAELLKRLGRDFDVEAADIDETARAGELPEYYVQRLALEKAQVLANKYPEKIIIAADTTVALGNEIFGKPEDEEDARRILRALSGSTHAVYTGHALLCAETLMQKVFTSESKVSFRALSDAEIETYIAIGESQGKAGAYAIQGKAAMFVEKLSGNMDNVIGLDVSKVKKCLSHLNLFIV